MESDGDSQKYFRAEPASIVRHVMELGPYSSRPRYSTSKIYSARLFIFHVCLFVSLVKTIPSQLSIQRLPCLHRDDLLDKSSIWAFGAQSRAMPGFNYSESS